MAKRILVTGGAGFIGSHLCEHLLRVGHQVVCLDNFISGFAENVAHLKDNKNFELVQADITKPLKIEGQLDQIYNLAAIASPIHYQEHPIETLMAGSLGVKDVLDLALEKKASFLQASTSEVYGDPLEHPQKESYWGNVNPIGLRSCYDESKRFAEALIMAYYRVHGLDAKIARIFNTYGPRMSALDGRVVPAFITQALKGDPLTVFGDGQQTRSFCFVSDLVDGLFRLMNFDFHEPVNLGNPNEKTMLELAEIVIKLTGSKSKLEFQPLPSDDPARRMPDIARAKEVLSWQPQVNLEEGLKKTIDFFKTKI